MSEQTEQFGFLNSNILKIIALVTMTIDHIGAIIFPQYEILRIIGRIAFPIFAYMIAEGCFYTKQKKRYLGEILIIGAICQVVFYIFDHSFYMCVMITFALSIMIIFSIQWAKKKDSIPAWILPLALIAGVYVLSVTIPGIVGEKVFHIDYGFVGIMIPVGVYLAENKWLKLLVMAGGLFLLGQLSVDPVQMWGLLALIPLLFYNGKRGKIRMGQFFYIYYPLHLGALWGINFALKM